MTSDFSAQLSESVSTLADDLDKMFLMVTNEFSSIKQVQKEMLEVQNRNWKVIKEHFAICKHNFNMKAILEASKQSHIRYRLSPAIPMDEILSYYEAQLLTGVITIKEGLLIKLVISLASR